MEYMGKIRSKSRKLKEERTIYREEVTLSQKAQKEKQKCKPYKGKFLKNTYLILIYSSDIQ